MSLTLFTGIGWAVEKQAVSASGNLTGPVFTGAVSTSPNSLRLTFDRALMLEYRPTIAPGGYRAKTLDISSFQIVKVVGGAPLQVVRTAMVDSTHIDLFTDNQVAANYQVTTVAGGVMDFWGNLISEQSQTFLGQQKADFPTPTTLLAFTSGYAGMQEDAPGEIYPDLDPPYLQNRNPNNGDVGVDPAGNVYLEIRDDNKGVNLSSVRIWVGGVLAFNGTSFVSPFNGPASAVVDASPAFQFTIDPVSPFPDYELVEIHVYARDLAPIYNELDTTYSFRVWDHNGPVVDSYAPTGTGASRNTLITFSVDEVAGAGVNLGSLALVVDGESAIVGGAFMPGFDGPGSAITPHHLGYDVTVQKTTQYDSFDYLAVEIYVEDVLGNITSFSWHFRVEDYYGPLVEPIDPTAGEVGVPENTNISLKLSDQDSVVASSIRVNVDRGDGSLVPAFDWTASPKFRPGFNGPASAYGVVGGVYTIVIDPTADFTVASFVRVEVLAVDPTGNPARL